MKKLADLTTFLTELNLVAAENIFSYVDEPKIIPSGSYLSTDSIILYRLDYTATINIERYPHKIHAAELLFGHVSAWLMDNDDDRGVPHTRGDEPSITRLSLNVPPCSPHPWG